jgi:phage terminase large subunit
MLPKGFNAGQHDNYMRLVNPETGAVISGEGGEDMGRGGRSSLYVVDEAAFVPNAETVEKALSGNTDCVIWVSSVNGMGNLFARKRHSILKPHQIFRLHWRDDPRKTEEWAAAKQASFSDPTTWASEYDIDYSASVEGICIPAKWVESAKRWPSSSPG